MTKRSTNPNEPQKLAAAGVSAERYLVPALIRGLTILQELSGERRKLTLSEVAAALRVTRSSAYRLLVTLGHLGFVTFDTETKTYALGAEVLRLGYGYLASRELVDVAMPQLVRLRDRTGWSAHLGELHGRDVVYLARVADPPFGRQHGACRHPAARATDDDGARVCSPDCRRTRCAIFIAMHRLEKLLRKAFCHHGRADRSARGRCGSRRRGGAALRL